MPSVRRAGYGFGNLTDLLRAAHKEGIVRVDRDRQGVIRVFQGTASPAAAAPSVEVPPPLPVEDITVAAAASEIGVPVLPVEAVEEEPRAVEEASEAPARKKRRARGTTVRAARAPRARRSKKDVRTDG